MLLQVCTPNLPEPTLGCIHVFLYVSRRAGMALVLACVRLLIVAAVPPTWEGAVPAILQV